jgi:hypothetical protein
MKLKKIKRIRTEVEISVKKKKNFKILMASANFKEKREKRGNKGQTTSPSKPHVTPTGKRCRNDSNDVVERNSFPKGDVAPAVKHFWLLKYILYLLKHEIPYQLD